MGYTLDCRGCDWAVDEPVELKGEANLLAGHHIAETGHSVELQRVTTDDEDFYRGGGVELLTEPHPASLETLLEDRRVGRGDALER